MRIITANVNGIRSAAKKGFFAWLGTQQADVICIQETKAQIHQLQEDPDTFFPKDYHCYYHDAQKKGYSGVALYCRNQPESIVIGMDSEEFDAEGRYLEARFGNLSVASLYLPSGSSGEVRQAAKYRCMAHFETVLDKLKNQGRQAIICGDWNIAHKPEDLVNWKANQKYSGFLPDERAWLDKLFVEHGFIDAFRELPQEPEQYTWWSMRTNAWDKNTGWRIDYHVLTPNLKGTVSATSIYRAEKFSDHAPVVIDYRKP